jgi:hypothetical protein
MRGRTKSETGVAATSVIAISSPTATQKELGGISWSGTKVFIVAYEYPKASSVLKATPDSCA